MSRVDRFRYVVLDFPGVDTVGQAFADEVFHLFARSQPKIEIIVVNETAQIDMMINRVLSAE